MKTFSIHDSKAEAYLPPIFLKSVGEAIRAFQSSCEDVNSQFYKYPSDFTLVELGEFNETTAEIKSLPAPRILANAAEYRIVSAQKISQTLKPLISELESQN